MVTGGLDKLERTCYNYRFKWAVSPQENNENMSVRGLVTVVIGVVAFVVIDSLITNIITGTDTGSVILQNLLRVIVAAAILIGVVMSIGRKGV